MRLVWSTLNGRAVPSLLHESPRYIHKSAKERKEEALPEFLAVHAIPEEERSKTLDDLALLYPAPVPVAR